MTDHQETMFDEPADFASVYEEEAAEEEAAYDAAEDAAEIEAEDLQPDTAEALEASVPEALAPEAPVQVTEQAAEPVAEPAAQAMQAYEPMPAHEPREPESALHPAVHQEEPAIVPPPAPLPILTADDFAALEERVLRAVSLVRREREARLAAEERSVVLEGRLAGLQVEVVAAEHLREEIASLRAEREQVRQRIERLLGQLDALEL